MQPDKEKTLTNAAQIDRDAYEPAYAQLANILRRQIAVGAFRPGDQLPSEAQLCRSYGISPMTVRRSINLLADQGVVSTAQGRGTFVRSLELGTAVFDLRELQDLFQNGGETAVKLLDVRVVSADERTARKLGDYGRGQHHLYSAFAHPTRKTNLLSSRLSCLRSDQAHCRSGNGCHLLAGSSGQCRKRYAQTRPVNHRGHINE